MDTTQQNPIRWSFPTAADELSRAQSEQRYAQARADCLAVMACAADDAGDDAQAVYWTCHHREAQEAADYWGDIIARMTTTISAGEAEEDDEA